MDPPQIHGLLSYAVEVFLLLRSASGSAFRTSRICSDNTVPDFSGNAHPYTQSRHCWFHRPHTSITYLPPPYGRRSNGDAFLGKCVTDLIHRNMSALNRVQKGKKFGHLFRSVLKLSHTESLLQFENLFQISTSLFSCQV